MPIISMQAPEGLSSFTHEGHPAEIGSDGVVQIDHRHAEAYMQHGFTLRDEPRRPPLAPPPRLPEPQMRETSPAVLALLDRLMGADPAMLARLDAALNEGPRSTIDDGPSLLAMRAADGVGSDAARAAVIHEADPRPATEPGPIPTDGPLTDEQIARMTPAQMKAWLKARDVPMVGVGNDADVLREKVRASNRG